MPGSITMMLGQRWIFLSVGIILAVIGLVQTQRPHGTQCIYCASGCNNVTGTCETCLDGLYGSHCNQTCRTTCRKCDQLSGKCTTCLEGWYGQGCTQQCANCHMCDKDTGNCLMCMPTLWGDNCQNYCPQNCHSCNVTNGNCMVCAVSYYGETCKSQCGNCKQSVCEKDTGSCIFDCLDGWHGPKCDKPCEQNCLLCNRENGECNMCKSGLWGPACDFQCDANCDFCNIETGECMECALGFYGKRCDQKCGQCLQDACDKDTGACPYECKPGFFGLKCDGKCIDNCLRCSYKDSCDVCHQGLAGRMCEIRCPDICASCYVDEISKQVTCSECQAELRLPHRNCTCSDKKCQRFTTMWGGLDRTCEECETGNGWFLHHGTCCPCMHCEGGNAQCASNGTCLQGCKPGFYPKTEGCHQTCDIPNCVWCEPFFSYGKVCVGCEDGYFPARGGCSNCSENCLGGECHNRTGECLKGCVPGWFGSRCDSQCNEQFCEDCHGGTACSVCKDGYWGTQCVKKCPDSCLNCDKDTGHCNQCKKTYYGDNCTESCKNCLAEMCNEFGQCQIGCKKEYYGIKCDKKCMSGCQICEDNSTCIECKMGLLYHNGQCKEHCTQCAKLQCDNEGACLSGCISGRYGQKCDLNCIANCDKCYDGQTCHSCSEGYRFENDLCKPSCDYCVDKSCSSDGTCANGCVEGRYGVKCTESCMDGCLECSGIGMCSKCVGKYKLSGSICVKACKGCLYEECNDLNECLIGCIKGRYGVTCEESCPAGCFECTGQNECKSCITGFTLINSTCVADCLHCKNKVCTEEGICGSECDASWYGPKCNQKCPDSCGSCSSATLCTSCKTGYVLMNGKTCEQKCQNCIQESCHENGHCISGCKSGWFGNTCTSKCLSSCKTCTDGKSCETCSNGKYGLTCEMNCPPSCHSCELNRTTHTMKCSKCKPGYTIPTKECSCTNTKCMMFTSTFIRKECLKCTKGWYPNAGRCCPCLHCLGGNNKCNGSNACAAGCEQGWFSAETGCDRECNIANCSTCGLSSDGTTTCITCHQGFFTSVDGSCIRCSKHCGSDGSCNPKTGKCTGGCKPGWKGERCNSAYIKIPFVSLCPDKCVNCNKSTGLCTGCQEGFWGYNCGQKCSSTCPNGCNQKTGRCYLSCSRYCFKKDNKLSCNVTTGHCYHGCLTGWRGAECRDKCALNCFDHSCDRFTGHCTKGCDKGWKGETCSDTKALIVLPSIGLIAGGITGAIVFIFILTMLIFFIYKGRSKQKQSEDSTHAVRHSNSSYVNQGMLMDSSM